MIKKLVTLEQPYSFTKIMNNFNKKGEPTTLQDLQTEINLIKQEIKELKTSNIQLQVSNEELIQELFMRKLHKVTKTFEGHTSNTREINTDDD